MNICFQCAPDFCELPFLVTDARCTGSEPELYSVDHTGLIQLWILVVSSVIAVFTNVCGFAGALFRIRWGLREG